MKAQSSKEAVKKENYVSYLNGLLSFDLTLGEYFVLPKEKYHQKIEVQTA